MALRDPAEVRGAYTSGWNPDPELTVSQWAEEFRWLSPESAAEPFRWRNDRTPYLVRIMDDLTPADPVQRVVFMKGSQIGATEAGNNWLGYIVHHAPGPILMMRPTVNDAKKASKQRLAPMIRDTPVLAERIAPVRSRDSGNTLLSKAFPGGTLTLAGANVVADLKSSAQRFLFPDEIDEYKGDVEGQGDPIDIVEKRTLTFQSRRKVFLVSTPTIKGMSRIEKAYLASDRRRFMIACPHCGHADFLTWEGPDRVAGVPGIHHHIRWDPGLPETARMVCGECEKDVHERHKPAMLAGGHWEAFGESATHGYHLSGLYSPWLTWAEAAREFLEVKDDPFRLRVWINQILGETYEERGDAIEPESILARLEAYPVGVDVPAGVGFLVSSTDVQDDRLETLVLGFGAGEESWVIDHQVFRGDTAGREVWAQLRRYLVGSRFRHENGALMPIEISTVDTNFRTQEGYHFCKINARRNVFAVRGGRERGKPIVQTSSVDKRHRVKVFTLCTDTAKDVIFGRLRIMPFRSGSSAPGVVHFPEAYGGGPASIEQRGVDQTFADQLTSEKAQWLWDKRRGPVRVWYKTEERNEILDLFVYAFAALHIAGPMVMRDLARRAKKWAQPVKNPRPKPDIGIVAEQLKAITEVVDRAADKMQEEKAAEVRKRDALLEAARARLLRRSQRPGRGWFKRRPRR